MQGGLIEISPTQAAQGIIRPTSKPSLRIGQRLSIQSNKEVSRPIHRNHGHVGAVRPQKSDVDEERQQMLDIIYQRAWIKGSKGSGSLVSSAVRRRRREAEHASDDTLSRPQDSPSSSEAASSSSSRFSRPLRSPRGSLPPVHGFLARAATRSGWIEEKLGSSESPSDSKRPPIDPDGDHPPSMRSSYSTDVWLGEGPWRTRPDLGSTGVRDILRALSHDNGKPTQNLTEVLRRATTVAANCSILALGTAKKYKQISLVADAMIAEGKVNEHTHGAIISALESAGRFDLAISHFEGLLKKGEDVGPVCASVVLKLCARRRDIDLALNIYHRLSGQSTLNRFSYNCLIHLCGVLGRMDDAVSILKMMIRDGGRETKPDSYTYGALLKAVANSKEYEWVPKIYREIQRSEVQIDEEVFSTLIALAGRADRPDLASTYYQAYRRTLDDGRTNPTPTIPKHIQNCLLAAHSRHAPLPEILSMYRKMLDEGLKPDEYTFNALFKAASCASAPLHDVEDLASEMRRHPQVKLNTILGTTIINAYRRSNETLRSTSEPCGLATELIVERVHRILDELAGQKLANCQTYGAAMVIHSHLGDPMSVKKLLERMEAEGVTIDATTYENVAKGFESAGLGGLASQLMKKAEKIEKPIEPRSKYDNGGKRTNLRGAKTMSKGTCTTSLSFEDI